MQRDVACRIAVGLRRKGECLDQINIETQANPNPKLTYKGYMRQETGRVRYITSNIAVEAVSVLDTGLPTSLNWLATILNTSFENG